MLYDGDPLMRVPEVEVAGNCLAISYYSLIHISRDVFQRLFLVKLWKHLISAIKELCGIGARIEGWVDCSYVSKHQKKAPNPIWVRG